MSSSDRSRGKGATARRESVSMIDSGPVDPGAGWLVGMQRVRPRHAAITRNLHTWSSYKSWAERVRDAWGTDMGPDLAVAVPKAVKK